MFILIPKRDEVLIRGVSKRGRWYGDIPGHVKYVHYSAAGDTEGLSW